MPRRMQYSRTRVIIAEGGMSDPPTTLGKWAKHDCAIALRAAMLAALGKTTL